MIKNSEIPIRDYQVLVRCFTYNQSKYIEDALNGFAMQKTDFPFACLVMDDASTDGEQEVIKAWMERECDMEKVENIEIEKSFVTIVPHKTNINCTFAFYFLKENLYKKGGKMQMVNPWRVHCEYEALCEGDDYWISPHKLQQQVSYIETHLECSLVSHKSYKTERDGNRQDPYTERDFSEESSRHLSVEDILKCHNYISTASMLYRSSFLVKYSEMLKVVSFDYSLKTLLALDGDIYVLDEYMSVYRHNAENSWSRQASADAAYYTAHMKKAIDAMEVLNKFSDYRYNSAFQNNILEYEYGIAVVNKDYNALINPPLVDLWRKKSWKVHLETWLKCKHKWISDIYLLGGGNYSTKLKKLFRRG